MFDAKAILEQLAKGAAPAAGSQSQGGGIGDILGQLLQAAQNTNTGGAASSGGPSGGLGDILGKLSQKGGQQPGHASGGGGLEDILRNLIPPNAPATSSPSGGAAPAAGGGLGDILAQLQNQLGAAGGAGGLKDILSQVLGQATEGVKEGAGRIGEATGARDALNKATGGQSSEDIIAKLKDLVANNQLAAGAAAGGLGGLLVGSKTGRGVIGTAVELGALALIGGLAYKAMQNYQDGKPLITGASTLTSAAPSGSGYEPEAQTNESATLLIRTMIAAAAADGRIDDHEKKEIIGSFAQSGGFNDQARAFVQAELANPASVEDLASAVTSAELAAQVYTAARVAIADSSAAEQEFLVNLARALGVDDELAAQIDATARSVAA